MVKFVERGGPTVMETVGRSNPGAKDWSCTRKECIACLSRSLLGEEELEDILKMRDGEPVQKKKQEDKVALPSCTAEGINYVIECMKCRINGIRRQYFGESSRSGFQRGR